ncbi:diaminohydroxyphosphoribosylaminopyrimidine deaminase [Stackebrandtia albiflava]|uniref:Diaminohydroxyphosphoribosylaminopyrimidine deaminase n=1 Tax=Stackebrandtia albiflava TaxID=406432 RepID=A0A562VBH7_9ACTN|nr:dCMP deaminase [Stackebrandtia albiflava]TWJ15177.1 diaminohydroxyphosphoribosylaminopyrimidine deaminase [Stackebrandtia albiflava]
MDDERWLGLAVELAGRCPPSATAFSVGAVVVADDRVVSQGYSRRDTPADHAEEVALRDVPAPPPGATVYSSMEPCGQRASRPRTCTDLILAAGVSRVVYALAEPELFVVPRGAARLREAGVEVVWLPEFAEAAAAVNAHLRG